MFTSLCYIALVSIASARAPEKHASIQDDGGLQAVEYDVDSQPPAGTKAMFRRQVRLKEEGNEGHWVASPQKMQTSERTKAMIRRAPREKQYTSLAQQHAKSNSAPACTGAYTRVGEGWCRPSGCDIIDDDCRTNGIYKDMTIEDDASNEIACRVACSFNPTCTGYALAGSDHTIAPARCYVHTNEVVAEAQSGWNLYPHSNFDVASFSPNNGVSCCKKTLCAVPTISLGVESWSEGCGSGPGKFVAEGTTCTITAASGFQCTSPGLCGSDGTFAAVGACQATCTVPTISDGVDTWSGENCASGATNVVQGTTCDITAASGYNCISPGECGLDGTFTFAAACNPVLFSSSSGGSSSSSSSSASAPVVNTNNDELCGAKGPDCQAGIDKMTESGMTLASTKQFLCSTARDCWNQHSECASHMNAIESPTGPDPQDHAYCPPRGTQTCYEMGGDCATLIDTVEQKKWGRFRCVQWRHGCNG